MYFPWCINLLPDGSHREEILSVLQLKHFCFHIKDENTSLQCHSFGKEEGHALIYVTLCIIIFELPHVSQIWIWSSKIIEVNISIICSFILFYWHFLILPLLSFFLPISSFEFYLLPFLFSVLQSSLWNPTTS